MKKIRMVVEERKVYTHEVVFEVTEDMTEEDIQDLIYRLEREETDIHDVIDEVSRYGYLVEEESNVLDETSYDEGSIEILEYELSGEEWKK